MIFDVGRIVADLSEHVVLEPGDVILTGTPEGVAVSGSFPYLKDGDVVEIGIEHSARSASATSPALSSEDGTQ